MKASGFTTFMARVDAAEYSICRKLNRGAAFAIPRRMFQIASRLGDGIIWYVLIFLLPALYGAIAVKPGPTEDELMDKVLEAGAEDILNLGPEGFEVRTDPAKLHNVATALEKAGVKLGEQRWSYVPQNTVKLDGEGARKMLKLMDLLEDNDDVQNVHANFEIDDALLQQLS